MSKVQVVSYNIEWRNIFKREKLRLKNIFRDNLIAIHHIGSTAIPRLSAKPIIDILVVVKDIFEVDKVTIEHYESRGELGILLRRYFSRGDIHLHVFEINNPEIDLHLKFRNYLLENACAMRSYENLKIQLALQYPNDRSSYSRGKNQFISDIIKKTGFDKICIRIAFHHEEMTTYNCLDGDLNAAYKFVIYQGAKIIGIVSISDALQLTKIIAPNDNYIMSFLNQWLRSENNKARTIRF